MKNIFEIIVTSFAFFVLLNSCEVEIDMPKVNEENLVTVTALAVSGENLSVRVSMAENLDHAVSDEYDDKYMMWRVLNFPINTSYNYSISEQIEKYYGNCLIKEADVTATINGHEYGLTYNNRTLNFESVDYKVQPGDLISISVKNNPLSNDGFSRNFNAHSSVIVPEHTGNIEIISAMKIHKEIGVNEIYGFKEAGIDSAMVFKLRIKAPSTAKNRYRLKVTSAYYLKYNPDEGGDFGDFDQGYVFEISPGLNLHVYPIDEYNSTDPLLYDPAIEKRFGPWPAFMTDVFSSEYFYENEYVIEVTSRLTPRGNCNNTGRYFEIELQPITRDLMEYLSSMYRRRVMTDSYFSQPSTLPSNIDGGTGIFGAIGKSAKIRYWLPGEENPAIPPLENGSH